MTSPQMKSANRGTPLEYTFMFPGDDHTLRSGTRENTHLDRQTHCFYQSIDKSKVSRKRHLSSGCMYMRQRMTYTRTMQETQCQAPRKQPKHVETQSQNLGTKLQTSPTSKHNACSVDHEALNICSPMAELPVRVPAQSPYI